MIYLRNLDFVIWIVSFGKRHRIFRWRDNHNPLMPKTAC